ncbi:CoB--CoM heterodisulfide reductase iron-sulfur subunit B family protein [Desulfoferrobacter suflitae]|uniref:CoB--CoM heterodisulfide reductase iron-sulfur subunit B family protein n=1 Tax=Desulfoferrobacter suflitae TaxID=2865782 RepID=UPI00216448F2|nr:CoB--CoM heterodisulfide reductase iron-sulfur subunit B family protein [Desulfoferrobacter suflitae]MCK8603611.1 CoB--CoM heterodisulfide reductase iron-sulfur subunit B family protein [Desulfoferrobacter suflitae]
MKRRIAYYQGCSLEGLAIEYDTSTRAVCEALDVELVEIPDWSCCGSTPAHSHDALLSAVLAGRNLAIAESTGCELAMTPCPGCLKSLKGALQAFHNQSERDVFLEILAMPFTGHIKAISILQLLYEIIGVDEISRRVIRPLNDLVLAPYYGCLLSRPAQFAEFDDPENPISMDELLVGAGAKLVDFPYKTECCGATYGVTRNQIVARLTGRILDMAAGLGAQAIVVACPLCQQNLDLRQSQVNRYWKRRFDIPVVYITQLLGLALGLEPEQLAWDKLFVEPDWPLTAPAVERDHLEKAQS